MTPEDMDLTERLRACVGWRGAWRWMPSLEAPDLSDPATLGCLLALVRELWGDPCVYVYAGPEDTGIGDHERCAKRAGYWHVRAPLALHIGHGETEAEALVAALEAAP